ncbi:MAG: glycosyl hydrolase family 5 [Rhodobacteraceae bacterium]|nr:glycosyl hydrolase family 5 [Paracoccaceae bacterium]
MDRRSLLSGLAAAALVPGSRPARAEADAWAVWRDRFVASDGRVMDTGQNGISHSEGQGYGLILAQAFGDPETFDRIEAWTRSHIANRQDALMSWKWDPSRSDSIPDWHNATDGDLFRAWAHLRAALGSGWRTDPAVAADITRDLVGLCLAPDPRAPDEVLLMPGAEALRTPRRVLVNPSYYLSRALRQLGASYDAPALIRAADHGETLLGDLAATGFLPDWVEVTTDGFVPPRDHDFRSAYDALRIPLYLCWSGLPHHPANRVILRMLISSDLPGHVAVWIDDNGQIRGQSNQPGFHAIATLAAGGTPPLSAGNIASQPYYPATLQMLAHVAAREGRA